MSAASPLGPLLLVAFWLLLEPAQGGNCWSVRVRNGRCTELLSEKVTKEECCASNSVATAWNTEDMDPGTLFFWRVLGGGVPCYACKETCTGVQCGDGRKCEVRRGQPKCVCSPDCRGKNRHKGPVCGSDGRTYRTVCRLRKRACRRKSTTLSVAYDGHCQSSCDRIHCPAGKHCLLDQNLSPHCVKCTQRCPARSPQANRHVCGADGVTYPSSCHLREAACHKGKAIPEAYKGRCKRSRTVSHRATFNIHGNRTQERPEVATCGSVQCRERQSCLIEPMSGAPRCVTCSYRCPKAGGRRDMGGPICGTNNLTYDSWCHMIKDACDTGYVIETKFPGHCETAGAKPTVANTVLDGAANTNRYS